MNRPRVLLADDHRIVLEGLSQLLKADFEIVGTVTDGLQLLQAAEKLRPDLVVLDISMANLNGLEAARMLRTTIPAARIVMLTMHADPIYAAEALGLGALGYVLKDSAAKDLVKALRHAMRGSRFVSPHVLADVPKLRRESLRTAPGRSLPLTPRQRQVLQLVAEGRSLKEIGAQLNISVKTVEYHKYHLMRRLGLRTTAGLTCFAVKHGVVKA